MIVISGSKKFCNIDFLKVLPEFNWAKTSKSDHIFWQHLQFLAINWGMLVIDFLQCKGLQQNRNVS